MTGSAQSTRSWPAILVADPRRRDLTVAATTVVLAVVIIAASGEVVDVGVPDVAAGMGAFVLVALRRRAPLPLLAVAVAWSAAHAVIWNRPSVMVFATLVLLATACVRLERGPAIALGVVVGLVLYAGAIVVNDEAGLTDGRTLIALAWAGVAVGVADAVRSWRRYREAAEGQVRAAVMASEARTRRQVTEERLAIARELHDLLAHNLSVMNVQTGAALHLLRTDPDSAEESLTAARAAGRSVLDELRELLAVLRDHESSDGEARTSLPMIADLPALVDTMRAAGLTVTWNEAGEARPLAPAVSLAVYRIVQEALTNAAKHGAGTATLTTEWGDETLAVTVTNAALPDGRAPDAPSGGHGLIGMRERAVAHGGALESGPTPSGFAVRARLPITPRSSEVAP